MIYSNWMNEIDLQNELFITNSKDETFLSYHMDSIQSRNSVVSLVRIILVIKCSFLNTFNSICWL